MEQILTELEQRTFDLQIPCTCTLPHFCRRYHGLPMPTAEFIATVPLFGPIDGDGAATGALHPDQERANLYRAYDMAPNGVAREEAFRRLTAPFNSF